MRNKYMALVIITILLLSVVACGDNGSSLAKEAFTSIDSAYKITANFAEDISFAWKAGIYDQDEIEEEGFLSYFSKHTHLTSNELNCGFNLMSLINLGYSRDSISEEDKRNTSRAENYKRILETFDSFFSCCVQTIIYAYEEYYLEDINNNLAQAKEKIKELSDKNKNSETVSLLKDFYSDTSLLLEYCDNPTGNYETMKKTIDEYTSNAKTSRSKLSFDFE